MIKKIRLLSLIIACFMASSCSTIANTVNSSSRPKVANSASIPTYVFYYAQWCGFCHKMAPAVAKAAEEYKEKIFFYYVDVDTEEGKEFISKYRPNGSGVPYAQYYDSKGNFIKDKIGLISYAELRNNLEKLL
jgi:thiol-disulfide isomerase/thioredoxin